jgi:hypothetical protein
MSERCFLVLAQAGDPAIRALRQLLPQQLAGRDERRHGLRVYGEVAIPVGGTEESGEFPLCSVAPGKTRLRSLAARGSCHGLLVHAGIADLSSSGWRSVVGRPELATAAADGRVLWCGAASQVSRRKTSRTCTLTIASSRPGRCMPSCVPGWLSSASACATSRIRLHSPGRRGCPCAGVGWRHAREFRPWQRLQASRVKG